MSMYLHCSFLCAVLCVTFAAATALPEGISMTEGLLQAEQPSKRDRMVLYVVPIQP